jgi:hypothetical protein
MSYASLFSACRYCGCRNFDGVGPLIPPCSLASWGIEDPKGEPIDKVREIRDEMEGRVKELAVDTSVTEERNSR